jgi:hypothetical protein
MLKNLVLNIVLRILARWLSNRKNYPNLLGVKDDVVIVLKFTRVGASVNGNAAVGSRSIFFPSYSYYYKLLNFLKQRQEIRRNFY